MQMVRCSLRNVLWDNLLPFQNWQVMICPLGAEFILLSLQPNGSVHGAELRPLQGNDLEKSEKA